MFDTHTHLLDERFSADRDRVIENAFKNGVAAMTEVADSEAHWDPALRLADRYPGRVWAALGFHPYHADRAPENLPAQMRQAMLHPRAVALGEIGLDYCRCAVDRETQKKVFTRLLEVSLGTGKPVIIHCRDAHEDVRTIVEALYPPAEGRSAGVLHCFQGDERLAASCLARGFYIGVDGPVTYPSAEKLRQSLKQVPLDRLVVETDCPYLPPQTHRGQRNEPAYLPAILRSLAELKGVSFEEMVRATTDNAGKLYKIPSIVPQNM
ncbi:MAG TPA: TatD family hydrolase [Elusimicrobiota bacterium]|nr:TatD family hydrolase [Elusimicrobiota bacterium]